MYESSKSYRPEKYSDFYYKLLNDQYFVGQKLDEGGYSVVCYAQDKSGKPKAIKFSTLNLSAQRQKMLKSVSQQDQAMRSINSSQVIQCQQTKADQKLGFKYIVMQLCNYFNLWHLIVLKGHLKQIQAKIYIKNILAGLISMHHFGYSHRDIKSCNICIKNGHCVIIDLGCSKKNVNTQQGEKFNKTVPKNATNAGTICNKSPEMLSSRKYSYRTDFWGIGILFYEMLTGVTPFYLTGKQDDEQALKIIKQNIGKIYNKQYIITRIKEQYNWTSTFPSRACSNISTQAREFLEKLITINPDDRFSEEQLKNSKYLMEEIQIKDIWEAAECLLPLSNIKWKQFTKKINQKVESKNNEDKTLEEKSPRQRQEENEDIFVSNISEQEKDRLRQNYQKTVDIDKENMNKMRVLHFQIKRIQLLIKLRNDFKRMNNPQLQLQPLIFNLTEYCQKKLPIINGQSYFNNIGIFSNTISQNFKKTFLSEYLNDLYLADKKQYEEWLRKQKKNKKQKMDPDQNQKECNQIVAKLKTMYIQNEEIKWFLSKHKQIFGLEYKPQIQYFQWITWDSLKKIVRQYGIQHPKK